MTSMELMELLGSVKDSYVKDAYQPGKRISYRRMVLIAAVITLALLLVGCAVAYVLSLESLKAGEPITKTTYDDVTYTYQRISLQGVNREALDEWNRFRDEYDPDGEKYDCGGVEIPENYREAYGCYSQEMVDKLEELVKKYDLKLLGPTTTCQAWQSQVLFDALSLDPLWEGEAEYLGGYFYREGTFDVDAAVTGSWEGLGTGQVLVGVRGSLKAYFDPIAASVGSIDEYEQWTYTRRDGRQVLIARKGTDGRIFADLPDIFVSVSAYGPELPESFLEDLAERLNLDLHPKEADLEAVERMLAQADEDYKRKLAEEDAASKKVWYSGSYEDYVNRVQTTGDNSFHERENLTYILYDVNGDGTEELIVNWYGRLMDIVTLRDGEVAPFELSVVGLPIIPHFFGCEGNVIELYDDTFGNVFRLYFQAGQTGGTFLFGLEQAADGTWTYYPKIPSGDPQTWEQKTVSQAEAEKLIADHPRVELSWRPLKLFGTPAVEKNYQDPYAQYIDDQMVLFEDGKNFTYTKLDLDGDGVEELITRNVYTRRDGEESLILSLHTVADGQMVTCRGTFTHVCQNGVLESLEENSDGGEYHAYYRYQGGSVTEIEHLKRRTAESTWFWDPDASGPEEPRKITAEEAQKILDSHSRIDLDMKPFSQYPLK